MNLEEAILDALGKIKATDILIYNMEGRSPFYDKMILCSVSSERQATAGISYIKEACAMNNHNVRSVEGAETPWVLVDCYDCIVSIFTKEERQHFSLEKIYMDVPHRQIED